MSQKIIDWCTANIANLQSDKPPCPQVTTPRRTNPKAIAVFITA